MTVTILNFQNSYENDINIHFYPVLAIILRKSTRQAKDFHAVTMNFNSIENDWKRFPEDVHNYTNIITWNVTAYKWFVYVNIYLHMENNSIAEYKILHISKIRFPFRRITGLSDQYFWWILELQKTKLRIKKVVPYWKSEILN